MCGNYLYKGYSGFLPFLLVMAGMLHHFTARSQSCSCDHVIQPENNYIDGQRLKVQPGDTVCIMAGKKKFLNLFNFYGTEEAPVVFINCGGQVQIGDPDWHYAFVMGRSQHFILTGTGDDRYEYGIAIRHTKKGVSGLALGGSHFKVDHIEVSHTGFAGIMAKVDPNCHPESWQQNYLMQNVSLHHNYVHDTGGEGFYIGYTGGPRTLHCDGNETVIQPHNIENIKIFNNRVENTGWDGIQVSRAVYNCEIFNNRVMNYGTKNSRWQQAGIVIGGGTTGKLFNNYIHTGTGGGIHIFGAGGNLIYNNVIINAGEDGIFCKSLDKTLRGPYGYAMINNTIIHPKGFGLKVHSLYPTVNRFYNNVVIQQEKLFISAPSPGAHWHTSHNYLGTDTLRISKTTHSHSPVKDQGKDVLQWGIRTDFYGNARPAGKGYDIGAYETDE